MKKMILYIAIAIFMVSCSNDDTPNGHEPVSKWKLTEILADPGDGSGTFNPVLSDKTVTFYSDGIIKSNGNLCEIGTDTTQGSTGTYTSDTIVPDSCPSEASLGISYTIEASVLIIHYPCIEACAEKYELIEE
ncbi:MAG: hypothetical protein R2812_01165 [Gelidibacter sp.]